ncbi:MAG: TolC family protein [Verrucomicrobia bacterium]|nr:TolC family protein [Verrucomicrobiota bacterium]
MRRADFARRLRLFAVGAMLLCAPTLARAQTTRPLTLENCVDLALGRSPDLRAADFDIASARETVTATRAGLLPAVSGALSLQGISGQPVNNFSLLNEVDVENRGGLLTNQSRTGLLGYGSASVNYNLFKDGSIFGLNDAPAVEAAKAKRTELTWTKALKREQIILVVATAFFDAATRAERLRLDTRRVALCEQQLETIEEQVRLGLKLPADAAAARAQLLSSRQVLLLSRAQDTSARLHLAGLLDRKPEQTVVSSRWPTRPALPPAEKFLADAAAKHPSVGVQNAVIGQQFNAFRLARAQTFPQVTANSNFTQGENLTGSAERHLYTGGVTLSVPIFDFGALAASKRAAADKYQAEKIRLEKVRDDIRNSILDAYRALIVIQAQTAAFESDAALAEKNYQVAREQAQAGLIPPLATVAAELAFIDKQESLNDERRLELQQFALFQYATGGTWAWIQ